MGKKILVVEDNVITALLLERILVKNGFKVVAKIGFAEEVEVVVSKEKPDAIIMDIMLEGKMTGIDAADALRKYSDIPIVFLSALSDNQTQQKLAIIENCKKMTKPFDTQELITSIKSLT